MSETLTVHVAALGSIPGTHTVGSLNTAASDPSVQSQEEDLGTAGCGPNLAPPPKKKEQERDSGLLDPRHEAKLPGNVKDLYLHLVPHLGDPWIPPEFCLLFFTQGPLKRQLPKNPSTDSSTQFHQRLLQNRKSGKCQCCCCCLEGMLDFVSSRNSQVQSRPKENVISLYHIPKWGPAIFQLQRQTCSSSEHNPQPDP